jgi:hypothetical protein
LERRRTLLSVEMHPLRALGDEFGKVTQRVEHGLFVKFLLVCVNYDGRVDKIVGPVGTAGHVERKVPINPTSHPVGQILIEISIFNESESHTTQTHSRKDALGVMYLLSVLFVTHIQ